MTDAETIAYLRLDADGRDPAERLRNLVRRQGLPVIRRGRLRLFRRSDVDAWLDGTWSKNRIKGPARLIGR
jgi:excisionase family DNA binding protein